MSQQVLAYFRKRKEAKEKNLDPPRPLPMSMEIIVRPWKSALRVTAEVPFRKFFTNEESGRGIVYQEVKRLLEGAEKAFKKEKLVIEINTRKGEKIIGIMHDCSAQVAAVLVPKKRPKKRPQARPKAPQPAPKPEPPVPSPVVEVPPTPEPEPEPKNSPPLSNGDYTEEIDFETMKFFPTDPSWRNIKKVFRHLGLRTGNDVMRMLGSTTPDYYEWGRFLNRLKQAANEIGTAFGAKCEDTLYVWLVNRKKWMKKLPPRTRR